jgi:hypothetical protein
MHRETYDEVDKTYVYVFADYTEGKTMFDNPYYECIFVI